jgi:hypothetical protein
MIFAPSWRCTPISSRRAAQCGRRQASSTVGSPASRPISPNSIFPASTQKAPPPKTPAFWDIVDANRAPEDAELADILDAMDEPDATTLIKIGQKAAGKEIEGWLKDRKNRRLIPHRLEKCGYVPVRNDFAKDGLWKIGTRQVIYVKSALSITERIRAANELMEAEYKAVESLRAERLW